MRWVRIPPVPHENPPDAKNEVRFPRGAGPENIRQAENAGTPKVESRSTGDSEITLHATGRRLANSARKVRRQTDADAIRAWVAEQVYAIGLKPIGRKAVLVRIPPQAYMRLRIEMHFRTTLNSSFRSPRSTEW